MYSQRLLLFCIVFVQLFLVEPAVAGRNRWTQIGPSGGVVTKILVAPSDPNVVYAEVYGKGIYRSSNAGRSWSLTGLTLDQPRLKAIHPNDPDTVFATSWPYAYIYKTTDGGKIWKNVYSQPGYTPFEIAEIVINPGDPKLLYADGRLVSKDGGETWLCMTETDYCAGDAYYLSQFRFYPDNPDIIYAIKKHRLYRSIDKGQSWKKLAKPEKVSLILSVSSNDLLFVSNGT